MNNCTQCGSPIPNNQSICSMCYGDIDYGQDGYYREYVEQQEKEYYDQEQKKYYEEMEMFEEMRKAGSSIPDKVEYLQSNGWTSYKHHDNWVKKSWTTEEKNWSLYDLHQAFEICFNELNSKDV